MLKLLRSAKYANSLTMTILVMMVLAILVTASTLTAANDLESSRVTLGNTQARIGASGALEEFYSRLSTERGFLDGVLNSTDCDPHLAVGEDVGGNPCWALLDDPFTTCPHDFETDCYHLEVEVLATTGAGVPIAILVELSGYVRCNGQADRCVPIRLQQRMRIRQFFDYLNFTQYTTLDPLLYPDLLAATLDPENDCAELFADNRDPDCVEIAYQGLINPNMPADTDPTFFYDQLDGPVYTADDYVLVCGTPQFIGDPASGRSNALRVAGVGYLDPDTGNMVPWRVAAGCEEPDTDIMFPGASSWEVNAPLLLLPSITTSVEEAVELAGAGLVFSQSDEDHALELTFSTVLGTGETDLLVHDPGSGIDIYDGFVPDSSLIVVQAQGFTPGNATIQGTVSGKFSVFVEGELRIVGDLLYADGANEDNLTDVLGLTAGESIIIEQDEDYDQYPTGREIHALILSLNSTLFTENWHESAERGFAGVYEGYANPSRPSTVYATGYHPGTGSSNHRNYLAGGSGSSGFFCGYNATTGAQLFCQTFDGVIYDMYVRNDGNVIVVGDFTNKAQLVNGSNGSLLGGFTPTALDPYTFTPVGASEPLDVTIHSITPYPQRPSQINTADTTYSPTGYILSGSSERDGGLLVRTNLSGAGVGGFTAPEFDSVVYDTAVDSNNQIIAVGDFFEIIRSGNSTIKPSIMRFNANGSFDSTFRPLTITPGTVSEDPIYAVDVDTSDRIYIGGAFTGVPTGSNPGAEATRRYLSRLNADDGYLDLDFPNLGLDGVVYALEIQPDQKLIFGGDFTEVADRQPDPSSIGELHARNRLGRIHTDTVQGSSMDGALDMMLSNPDINNTVRSITVMRLRDATGGSGADSYLPYSGNPGFYLLGAHSVIGGDFTSVAGVTQERGTRLEASTGWVAPNLTFFGSIAARYQGVFGGFDPEEGYLTSGFRKDFTFDFRPLRDPDLTPPFLLSPVGTPWQRLDVTELPPFATGLFDLESFLANQMETEE